MSNLNTTTTAVLLHKLLPAPIRRKNSAQISCGKHSPRLVMENIALHMTAL